MEAALYNVYILNKRNNVLGVPYNVGIFLTSCRYLISQKGFISMEFVRYLVSVLLSVLVF